MTQNKTKKKSRIMKSFIFKQIKFENIRENNKFSVAYEWIVDRRLFQIL